MPADVNAKALDIVVSLSEAAEALTSAYAMVGAIDALFELAGPIDLAKVDGSKQLDHAHTLCRPLMEAIDLALQKIEILTIASDSQSSPKRFRLAA